MQSKSEKPVYELEDGEISIPRGASLPRGYSSRQVELMAAEDRRKALEAARDAQRIAIAVQTATEQPLGIVESHQFVQVQLNRSEILGSSIAQNTINSLREEYADMEKPPGAKELPRRLRQRKGEIGAGTAKVPPGKRKNPFKR